MGYPSPAALAVIGPYVTAMSGGWSNTDAQIIAAMNAPTVANPTPRGTVPTPYTATSLLSVLSQASAASVEAFPGITQLFSDITNQNTPNVLAAVALMVASGRIQSSEATAMEAILEATEPDPSWPAQIGWAQDTLGRTVDDEYISQARFAITGVSG